MKNYAAKLMFRTVQFFAYLFLSGLCKIICIEMQPKLSHLINIPANFPMFPRSRARYLVCMPCTHSRSISGAIRPQVSYRGDGSVVESDPPRHNTFSCSTNSLETRNPSNFFLRFFNHIICRKKYFLSLVLGQYWWLSNLKENMWVGQSNHAIFIIESDISIDCKLSQK